MRPADEPGGLDPFELAVRAVIGQQVTVKAATIVARLVERLGEPIETHVDGLGRELDQFFAGRLKNFTIPVAPRGTDFQRRVWNALQKIPYGRTVSYGAIAKQIDAPAAVRAVGAANGANPICIIIPCRRVIGANGSLTGFGADWTANGSC